MKVYLYGIHLITFVRVSQNKRTQNDANFDYVGIVWPCEKSWAQLALFDPRWASNGAKGGLN